MSFGISLNASRPLLSSHFAPTTRSWRRAQHFFRRLRVSSTCPNHAADRSSSVSSAPTFRRVVLLVALCSPRPATFVSGQFLTGFITYLPPLCRASLTRLPIYYLIVRTFQVGAWNGPVIVRQGRATGRFNISLRPMALTDPPLLISLPFLLADTLK